MSALTTLCDPNGPSWPIVLSEGNTPLTLPDGTSLVINVAHAGPDTSPAQGGDHSQPRHVVSLRRDEQNKTGEEGYSAWVNPAAPRSRLFVTPPLPPYKGQTDEPDDNTLSARCKRWGVARLFLDGQGAQVTLRHLWTLEDALYVLWPAQEGFVFHICNGSPTQRRELVQGLYECGLAVPHPEAEDRADGPVLLPRSAFWQGAGPFARPPWISPLAASEPSTPQPVVPTPTFTPGNPRGSLHPTRPVKPSSDTPLYKRYCPPLKETLTFTPASASNGEHVKLCAKWHNSTRVNDGWRQQGSEEEHRAYLRKIEESPDSLGLIGAWNGEPWGYVEVYWVKENAIGAYFGVGDYDRGFHALVGEDCFRGPHRVRTWMGSLIHMMFCLDPRTERVVSEPRASNTKMVEYECSVGGHVEKLLDLPHKRAALVLCPRERFFQLCPLGPLPAKT